MGQLLDVTAVTVLSDNRLVLNFENGEVRLFDMSKYIDLKPYKRLKNSPQFRSAKVEYGTVVWPGEIDIAPETLYMESEPYMPESTS